MTQVRFKLPTPPAARDFELSGGQAAVEALPPEAIAVVLGSPASGKTTAVRVLVQSSLARGLQADQILVLAANREAANALRDQIAIDLQTATPGPMARTLTSFAFGLLRQRAISNGLKLPELISGSEQDRILAEVLANAVEGGIDELGFPKHINQLVLGLNGFRAELRDLVTVALEHGVSPESLAQLGANHGKLEWQAASKLYEQYLNFVSAPNFEGRFDASMLLREATQILKSSDSRSIKLVVVDDAQELTPAAANLLKVLCSPGTGLVLVGDPDSSTLGFRAADPRAMTILADEVAKQSSSPSQTIVLEALDSVRSSSIASVLGKVSRQIDTARAGRQRKGVARPQDSAVADVGVEGLVFNSPQAEAAWLARRLRELHLYEGVEWSQMAVVARSRSNLEQYSVALAHQSVPVEILGAQSALRDEFASRMLLRFARQIYSAQSPDIGLVLELLTSPICGLDSLGLRRLRRSLRREELSNEGARNSDELILALFDAEGSVVTLKSQEGKRVDRFLKLYFEALQIAGDSGKSIEDLLWHIWSGSGLERQWGELAKGIGEVALQANRNLDAVVALFAAANRFVERNPNGDAAAFVDSQLALGLPEDTLALNNQSHESVALVTPSGLISRRFRVVALPGLIEGVWPNLRPRSSLLGATALDGLITGRLDDPNDLSRSELPDELRMLYKAVGAASERLLISAPDSEDNQLSQFVGLLLGQVPDPVGFEGGSLTLRGLSGALRRTLAGSANQSVKASAALGLARLAAAGIAGAHPASWHGLLPLSTIEPLTDLTDPESSIYLRPSQLENYLKCPLHWFLNAHGGSDSTFSANLGTLVHSVFESADISTQTEEQLWSLVESKWHTLSFESAWLAQAGERKAKRMVSNLVQYLRKFEADGAQVIGREVSFQFKSGQATVSGQVDRLELFPDGRVMIVDLKTGSRDISKDQAAEHAQLGMYQLAFENGAFNHLTEMPTEATLAGAKLLLISGDKPVERAQESLASNEQSRARFEEMIRVSTEGMADRVFVAQVGSHCENENEFGTCQLHLVKGVTYVG